MVFLVGNADANVIRQHPEFVPVEGYSENVKTIKGEIGKIWGYRIVETYAAAYLPKGNYLFRKELPKVRCLPMYELEPKEEV